MTVYLVGAGPGDPGLLTLRGADLLANADVIVHDRLIGPEVLALAGRGAKLVDAGKAPGEGGESQARINEILVELGRQGLRVVRLKGGDPFVLGRGGEEVDALLRAGIPVEVVPGVTSAVAAPAVAGIPVTHRSLARGFVVVTAAGETSSAEAVDWSALAASRLTIVVLMGAALAAVVAERLIAGGLPPDTPAAAVRNGTLPDQQVWRGSLAALGEMPLAAPVTIVVGAVAELWT